MSHLKFWGCLWTTGIRMGATLLKSHPTNFHRSLASYVVEKKKLDFTPLRESKLPVIFVFGGPGSGKGTQCDKLVHLYGYTHLSSGNLLRKEVSSGSERGKTLNAIMEEGDLVPLEIVLELLAEAMLEKASTSKGFLIDGYPREKDQAIQFEQNILPCTKALYFELPDEVMVERLLIRAKTSGRVDDNETTIRKRLTIFHRHFEPIISHYNTRCSKISALATPEEVFTEVQKALGSIL